MKRNFEIIKSHDVTDTIMSMQDEDAQQLLASRKRLLALNAMFDAALVGTSAKNTAKDINFVSSSVGESFVRHLQDEKSTTEH